MQNTHFDEKKNPKNVWELNCIMPNLKFYTVKFKTQYFCVPTQKIQIYKL